MATATTRRGQVGLADISLRSRESALLTGGTQVGKSTLSDYLGNDFLYRYPQARELVSDTKPRYIPQWTVNGTSARRMYKDWDHGAYLPGSCLVRDPDEMRQAFNLGYRRVLVQSENWEPHQDECIGAFHKGAKRGRPQLLRVDETCDHFHGNGMPRGKGWLVVVSRAGAERGEGGLYASQRTKGISGHLLEHMRRLYAFRLDNWEDAKRFAEFGCRVLPPARLPTREREFYYWTKDDYHHLYGPYVLAIGRGGS